MKYSSSQPEHLNQMNDRSLITTDLVKPPVNYDYKTLVE